MTLSELTEVSVNYGALLLLFVQVEVQDDFIAAAAAAASIGRFVSECGTSRNFKRFHGL